MRTTEEMGMATRWLCALGLLGAVLTGALGLTGCENPYYCAGKNPLDSCLVDQATACTGNGDCAQVPGKAVCDLEGTQTCVQCNNADKSACTGEAPVCAANSCRGCTEDAECGADGVCLPTGACTTSDKVAYVSPQGATNAPCSKAAPCSKVAEALAATPARSFVLISGTIDEAVVINNRNLTFVGGQDGKLTRMTTGEGPVLTATGTSQLAIYTLTIEGGDGATGTGIEITGAGVSLSLIRAVLSANVGGGLKASGGTVEIRESQIVNNAGGGIQATGTNLKLQRSSLQENNGGGINLTGGQFAIENNVITDNGVSGLFGGVIFSQISTTGNVFQFNTVSRNAGMDNATTGVVCATIGAPLNVANNIIYNNRNGNAGNNAPQVTTSEANCAWQYSLIGPMFTADATNLNADPMFSDAANGNFHLLPASPARDRANPAAAGAGKVTVDFEGDVRPMGLGPDMGADEIRQ
jgi:Right handed beta helix region